MTAAMQALAEFAALRFVDALLGGTCVALFAALVLRLSRRQNAGARYAVGFAALMAIALLPFAGMSQRAIASTSRAAVTLPESWAIYLLAAWGLITGWFLWGLARALWHLRSVRKSCVPIDPQHLDPLLRETFHRPRLRRNIALCSSEQVRVPAAIGLMKPTIAIPAWALRELSAEELNQILIHELAHLRRWDDWTNLAQQIVRAIFFFHPAVWWIEKRMELEREMACDDAVLAESASPRAYAECLARLAEKSFIQRSVALTQAALGRIRQTSLRVAQILKADRPKGTGGSWKPAVGMVAGFALICAVGVSKAPTLIAFQDGVPTQVAAQASMRPKVVQSSNEAKAGSAMMALAKATNAHAVPARLKVDRQEQRAQIQVVKASVRSDSKRPADSMVHLTSVRSSSLQFSETVVMVIDGGRGPLQIEMWRVVVLHPAVDPDTNPPRKTT